MEIQRLAVRNFRKLLHGVVIDDFDPGLTVIVGENEEGKSTLLKAFQAAFFDRYNLSGQAIDEMVPFGSNVRPEIEVDFDVDGTAYHLVKGFNQSASALMEANGQRWENDSVEEQLRDMFGFSPPGRGASKEEHRGLSGLLWVEQGRAFAPLNLNEESRSALQDAIEGEVGQVLGGDRGRNLLAAVEQKCASYFTRTGRERNELKEARDGVDKVEADLAELVDELSQYEKAVDRLANLKKSLASYDKEGLLRTAQAEREEAQAASIALENLEGQVKTAEAEFDAASLKVKAAKDLRDARKDNVLRLEKSAEALSDAEKAFSDVDQERADAIGRRNQAETALGEVVSAARDAQSAYDRAQRERQRAEAAVALADLSKKFQRAEQLSKEIRQSQEGLAAIRVDDKALNKLRTLEAELGEKRAALAAVATRLEFTPTGNQTVRADDVEVRTDAPYQITETTEFGLEGFGEITIVPGGEDIRLTRQDLATLEADLNSELKRLGCGSVEEAVAAVGSRASHLTTIDRAEGELEGLAPEGTEHLQSQISQYQQDVAAATTDDQSEALEVDEARRQEETTLNAKNEQAIGVEEAEARLGEERGGYERSNELWIKAKAGVEHCTKEVKNLTDQVTSDRAVRSDEDLAAAIEADRGEHETKLSALKKLQDQVEKMEPEAIRGELERAIEAYETLQLRMQKDRDSARDLEAELRGQGQKGLGEELERREGELEAARAELARLELDAKAWKMLRDTLEEAESEAKEIFLGPVRDRLTPYLKLLFPETEMELSEDALEIVSLKRGNQSEPFTSLSMGTREQVAVLARLALAKLLREKGQPVVLILDDALVNSDDQRFKRMELALRKAAENVQIVILTCHESRYLSLGAKMVRLAECGAA